MTDKPSEDSGRMTPHQARVEAGTRLAHITRALSELESLRDEGLLEHMGPHEDPIRAYIDILHGAEYLLEKVTLNTLDAESSND